MKLASRMQRLGTETAFEVLVRARALEAKGRDIIHLEIGEPDFDTPVNVREAAKRPVVGDKWPREGLFLPDEATFRQAVESANSARTLNSLFLALEARPPAEAP